MRDPTRADGKHCLRGRRHSVTTPQSETVQLASQYHLLALQSNEKVPQLCSVEPGSDASGFAALSPPALGARRGLQRMNLPTFHPALTALGAALSQDPDCFGEAAGRSPHTEIRVPTHVNRK